MSLDKFEEDASSSSVVARPLAVFVFFSNPAAFDSLLLDALGALEQSSKFAFNGCLFLNNATSAERWRKKITSVGLDSENWTFIYPTIDVPVFGRKFSHANRLLAEIFFWKKTVPLAGSRHWDGVIVHSENFLSDHVTLSMVSPERRMLVNPLNDMREHYESQRSIFSRRLRQIQNSQRGDFWDRFSAPVAAGANLLYRHLMPTAFKLITKRRLRKDLVARRFVAGGNCELYVVTHETAERIVGRFPSQQTLSIIQLPEKILPDGPSRDDTLLILSEVPRAPEGRKQYTDAVASDLAEARKIVEIGKISVRPHPKWFEEGVRVCEELALAGFDTELGPANERLNVQLASSSVVLSVWSSALYQAVGFSAPSRVIGLLSPSLLVEPNLIVDRASGVTWVPQRLFEKMHPGAETRGTVLSHRKVKQKSLRMSEVIAGFFRGI